MIKGLGGAAMRADAYNTNIEAKLTECEYLLNKANITEPTREIVRLIEQLNLEIAALEESVTAIQKRTQILQPNANAYEPTQKEDTQCWKHDTEFGGILTGYIERVAEAARKLRLLDDQIQL